MASSLLDVCRQSYQVSTIIWKNLDPISKLRFAQTNRFFASFLKLGQHLEISDLEVDIGGRVGFRFEEQSESLFEINEIAISGHLRELAKLCNCIGKPLKGVNLNVDDLSVGTSQVAQSISAIETIETLTVSGFPQMSSFWNHINAPQLQVVQAKYMEGRTISDAFWEHLHRMPNVSLVTFEAEYDQNTTSVAVQGALVGSKVEFLYLEGLKDIGENQKIRMLRLVPSLRTIQLVDCM